MRDLSWRILRTLKYLPQDVSSAGNAAVLPSPKRRRDEDELPQEREILVKKHAKTAPPPPPPVDGDEENFDPNAEYYRRPDPDSATLFDPDLLAAFRCAVDAHRQYLQRAAGDGPEATADGDPFAAFEKRCPPGGSAAVVLYTTTLRGVRKTFEDCNRLRFLLENLRVAFVERDVSMDAGYKDELWCVLGYRAIPPRLFINGRYIGGAEEAVALHEAGRLRRLLRGIPTALLRDCPCDVCGGARFMLCGVCRGSHRLYDGDCAGHVECPSCNENGLIACPLCSR